MLTDHECLICDEPVVPFLAAMARYPRMKCLRCGTEYGRVSTPGKGLVIMFSRRPHEIARLVHTICQEALERAGVC